MKYSSEELLKRIKELEAELKSLKKYGLVWDKEHTKEDVVLKCEKSIPILVQDDSKKLLFGEDNNILIEGDNYHALTALNMIGKESVDVIYIDPPYNTGHEDFIYNDNFINEDDGFRHSKWLSFMQKRLILSKELLSKKGVIFISIDDNENSNLRLLCDSIFGRNNFLSCFLWEKNPNPTFLNKDVRDTHEYILCYCKNQLFFDGLFYDYPDAKGDKDAPFQNKGNPVRTLLIRKEFADFIFGNKNEKIHVEEGKYGNVELHDGFDILNGKALSDFRISGTFRMTQEYLDNANDNGQRIIFKTNKLSPRLQYTSKGKKFAPKKHIDSSFGTTQIGNNDLKKLGVIGFEYPKPVSLIKYIVSLFDNKNSIVLDFFAGSGTTGQAVLELNEEDGGHRKFILCTNNENNICSDVTYPRLKTVITGIRADGSKYSEGIPSNLYYFKTDFIDDNKNTEQAKYNLVEKVDSLLCIKEDIFEEKERNDFSSHYVNGNKHLFIYNDYFNEEKFKVFKETVLNCDGEKTVYIYSSDNNLDESLIEGEKVILKPIPSKIYEIYKEIVEEIKRGVQ